MKKNCLIAMAIIFASIQVLSAASSLNFSSNGSVSFGNSIDINSGNSSGLTIEMWVKVSPDNYGNTEVFRFGPYIFSLQDNALRVTPPGGATVSSRIKLPDRRWVHVAYQIGGNTLRLFTDGAQALSIKNVSLPAAAAGASSLGGNSFSGSIDEVRVSNTARYTSAFDPQTAQFPADADTMGLWHFDDGAGVSAVDSSGRNITGALSAVAWGNDIFTTQVFRAYKPAAPLDPSPFGISIHLWNTMSYWYRYILGDARVYDDGIDDGMTNSKIFSMMVDAGARWVRDYGEGESQYFYWPDVIGYDYTDSYARTLDYFRVNALHTNIGFGGCQEEYNLTNGYAPADWPRFFRLQKEAAYRYRNTIKEYKVGHEVDNLDSNRWVDTCKNYVRYLKYSHDAIKAADPDIRVQIGDICQPFGGNAWNNGEYYYADVGEFGLSFTDESSLDKMFYEITANGKEAVYDTTHLGGFPASDDPVDYFDSGFGFTCYQSDPPNMDCFDANIGYITSLFLKYNLIREEDAHIGETGVYCDASTDNNAQAMIPSWRYFFRTGLIRGAYLFHLDGMGVYMQTKSKEMEMFQMVNWDIDRDCVFDENPTKYPSMYAFKKMTHLQARLEEFDDDEFKETETPGAAKFYKTGWLIANFSTWTIKNGEFSGQTGTDARMSFNDLVLPTYTWRKWTRINWQQWALNRYFVVRMKSDRNLTATLYWDNVSLTYNQSDFTDVNNSVSISVTGDNEYHLYKIDLSQNQRWEGVVSAVRFDPGEASGANIGIDCMGFLNRDELPAKLAATPVPAVIRAGVNETSDIIAKVVNINGDTVLTSTAVITFSLEGPGSFSGTAVKTAVSGAASITYIPGLITGVSTITASSQGLPQALAYVSVISSAAAQRNTITVLSPETYDVHWIAGAVQTVLWSSQGNVGNVNLDISKDRGITWLNLAANTANDGIEAVVAPLALSSVYKIRVQDVCGTPSDTSNVTFTIYSAPHIQVSSPVLNFGDIYPGSNKTLRFAIKNTGSATLTGAISSPDKWISVAPPTFADNFVNVDVTVDISAAERNSQYTGKINITSNGGSAEVSVNMTATCILVKPNPASLSESRNGGIRITFFGDGIVPGETTIKIYTLSGTLIDLFSPRTTAGSPQQETCGPWSVESGPPSISWQPSSLTPGIYIYTYSSPKERGVAKFTVIR